jgi:hypothetical protein
MWPKNNITKRTDRQAKKKNKHKANKKTKQTCC